MTTPNSDSAAPVSISRIRTLFSGYANIAPERLRELAGISLEEAIAIRERWLRVYPEMREFFATTKEKHGQ